MSDTQSEIMDKQESGHLGRRRSYGAASEASWNSEYQNDSTTDLLPPNASKVLVAHLPVKAYTIHIMKTNQCRPFLSQHR